MKDELVAPCGMNCNVCSAYLALSKGIPKARGKITHCSGCLPRGKMCAFIKRHCGRLGTKGFRFCYECADFPCAHLMRLSGRYMERYNVDLVGNLREIRALGVDGFLKNERARYRCTECGGTKSIHNGRCYDCEKITSWKK